ncbi:MAG: dTDP-4-dehydrorhamnose reductase [Bacteroidetes bacterium]|nr:MAG: dTDP-4-dehydrorhamnose reductase [Bacteroidota bacterium]
MSPKTTILVTGGNGQLGRCFQDVVANYPTAECIFLSKMQLDVCSPTAIMGAMQHLRPQVCINAAAYTAVDMAETDSTMANELNANAVANIATVCNAMKIRFIHISTDYVFDGAKNSLYTEEDDAKPLSVYGETKLKGEQLAMQNNPDSAIVRTSWVYSPHGTNFVKTMVRLMHSRPTIGVVNDQVGCPTYGVDLAHAIMQMALSTNWQPGIFHYSNTGPISWWQFAQAIQQIRQFNCQVNGIPTSAYPTAARRPAFTAFDCSKIGRVYGIRQIPWQDSLNKCLALL